MHSEAIDDWKVCHGPRQWRAGELFVSFGMLGIRSGTGTIQHTRALLGFAECMSGRACVKCRAGGEFLQEAAPVAELRKACRPSWARDWGDNHDMFRVST